MMSRSIDAMIFRFSRPKSNLLSTFAPGTKGLKGSWKKEWMVTPPALMAATPVGATTMGRLRERSTTVFRKVVLPVPALPVRKMLRPVFSTKSHAVRSSLFSFIVQNVSVSRHKDTKKNSNERDFHKISSDFHPAGPRFFKK